MPLQSRYVLVVDGLSSQTRSKDVEYELAAAGPIRAFDRDHKTRCALVESSDAKWAWSKLDGLRIDGRSWRIEYATPQDFKMFGWKWTEGGLSPSPRRGRSRSRSPPDTPHDKERRKADASPTTEGVSPAERGRSRSRSRSPARSGGGGAGEEERRDD